MAAVEDLNGFAASLNSVATDPGLDPEERIAELRKIKDEILSARSEIRGSTQGDYAELTALAGQADSYIGDNHLRRESASMRGALGDVAVRENADIRDSLISLGVATPEELDAAGWPSHDDLDAATDDGEVLSEAFGLGMLHGDEFNLKVKRDHGRFSASNVPGEIKADVAKAAAAPPLAQRGDARKPLPGGPAAPIKPGKVAQAAPPAVSSAPAPPRPAREATDDALRNMFDPSETTKPKQTFGSAEKLFAAAGEAQPGFEKLLNGDLGGALGAHTPGSLEEAMVNAQRDPSTPQVVMGPMKQMERAQEKVDTKYEGDWDRLQDVLRGTVVVPSLDHMPAAVEAIRQHAEANGWKMQKAENRFSDPPPPHNIGPTPAGYRDTAVALVSPNGVVSELQINTAAMFSAKQGEGHHLYEQSRSIEAGIKARSGGAASPGTTGPTDAELHQLADLEERSKTLYNEAWKQSYAAAA